MHKTIILALACFSIAALAGCAPSRHALPYDYKDDLATVMYDYDKGKASADDVVAVVQRVLRADRECGSDLSCRKVLRLVDKFKKGRITQQELEYHLQMERVLGEKKKPSPATNGK